MPDVAATVQADTSARAGLGRRILAILLDILIVSALLAAIGLAFASVTNGKVRVANGVLNHLICTEPSELPAGLALPAGFGSSEARRCTRSFLGFEHDWTLVVQEKMAEGDDAGDRQQIALSTDMAGVPVSAFYVDDVFAIVMAVYLFMLEWRGGATPGKRAASIRVRSLDSTPLGTIQVAKRTLIRALVFVPFDVYEGLKDGAGAIKQRSLNLGPMHSMAGDGVGWLILALLMLAFLISFAVAVYRRWSPPHDWWAGTEVVDMPAGPQVRTGEGKKGE